MTKEFFSVVEDPKYNSYTKKIPIDNGGSTMNITKIGPISGVSASGYNYSSNPVVFRVSCDQNRKFYPRNFAFIIKCHAESDNGRFPDNNCDGKTCSIPPNTPSALIKNFTIKMNNSGNLLEKYETNNFGHSNMIKIYTELSHEMLNQSDIFFTPFNDYMYITSRTVLDGPSLDTAMSLSRESMDRGMEWLGNRDVDRKVKFLSKLIPLPLISSWASSCDGFVKCDSLEFQLSFNAQNEIIFQTSQNTDTNIFVIDDVELVYNEISNAYMQDQLQSIESAEGRNIQRFAYLYHQVTPMAYVSNQMMMKSGSENVSFSTLVFPAPSIGAGINPYQYVANEISSYQSRYYGSVVPQKPMELDVVNKHENTELYHFYKLCLKKEAVKNFNPAIPFYGGYVNTFRDSLPEYGGETCNLYCIPYNHSELPVKTPASTIYIYQTQTQNNFSKSGVNCFLITSEWKFVQCNSDGTLEKIESPPN